MPKNHAGSTSQNSDEQVRGVSAITHSVAKSILAEVGLLCECCVELLKQSKEKQAKYDPAFPLLIEARAENNNITS